MRRGNAVWSAMYVQQSLIKSSHIVQLCRRRVQRGLPSPISCRALTTKSGIKLQNNAALEGEDVGTPLGLALPEGFPLMYQHVTVAGQQLPVIIPRCVYEVMDWYEKAGLCDRDPYWSRPWPSAVALATQLLLQQRWVQHKRVVEIGAGIGVAGLAACMAGASHVSLTDREELGLLCAALTARVWGLHPQWNLPQPSHASFPPLCTALDSILDDSDSSSEDEYCSDDSSQLDLHTLPQHLLTAQTGAHGSLSATKAAGSGVAAAVKLPRALSSRVLEGAVDLALKGFPEAVLQFPGGIPQQRDLQRGQQRARQIQHSLRQNRAPARSGLSLDALDWTHIPTDMNCDVVLCCDVLYEKQAVRPVAHLVDSLLGTDGRLLLADPPNRAPANRELFLQTLVSSDVGFVLEESRTVKVDSAGQSVDILVLSLRRGYGTDTVGVRLPAVVH